MLLFCIGTAHAIPLDPVIDNMKIVLARTSDPHSPVALLLNQKDLNEDNALNLPYSTQLFREAAVIGETYAMSAAILPTLNRYSPQAEKRIRSISISRPSTI